VESAQYTFPAASLGRPVGATMATRHACTGASIEYGVKVLSDRVTFTPSIFSHSAATLSHTAR